MKKILSTVLAILMLSSIATTALAATDVTDDRITVIRANVNGFLNDVGETQTADRFLPLYNFGDELEALLFPLDEGGYAVASYKDGHVIEYSPDDLPASPIGLSSDDQVYYGGPFSFYVKVGDQYENIISGAPHEASSGFYSLEYVPNIEAIESRATRAVNETPLLTPPSNYVGGEGMWYCTLSGITNLLQYYKDTYGADVYSGNVSSVSGLRNALSTNKYIYNGGLLLSDAARGHTSPDGDNYLGLRSYFGRPDVSSYYVTVTGLSVSNVKTQIDRYSRPALLHVYTSCVSSGASSNSTHIVLCYGYWETSMTTYYIVNNGWGSNSVYACADDIPTSFEMMYLQ